MSTFNAFDDPWIEVIDVTHRPRTLSLSQVLERSHEIADVTGYTPAHRMAILRLLVALVHRVTDGPERRAWDRLWDAGRLDPAEIAAYGRRWHERFDLTGEHPFLQVPGVMTHSGDVPTWRSVGDVSAFGATGARPLPNVEPSGVVTPAEALNIIVALPLYDVGGLKSSQSDGPVVDKSRSSRIGWGSGAVLVAARGETLFETLMLNTIPVDAPCSLASPSDTVLWERDRPAVKREIQTFRGPLDALVPGARNVLLDVRDGMVHAARLTVGENLTKDVPAPHRFDSHALFDADAKTHAVRPLSGKSWRARSPWTLSTFLSLDDRHVPSPAIAEWVDTLARDGVLGHPASFTSVRVVPGNSGGILDDVLGDELTRPVILATDREVALELVADCATALEKARRAFASFTSRIAKVDDRFDRAQANEGVVRDIDRVVRDWLAGLTSSDDLPAERARLYRDTRHVVLGHVDAVMDGLGPRALGHRSPFDAEMSCRKAVTVALPEITEENPS